MNSLAIVWCRLYTAAAPAGACERRREEVAAHVWDAVAAGRPRREIALAALLGAVDDLRWCGEERRRAGLAPVAFGTAGSSAIVVTFMALSYLLELHPTGRFTSASEVLSKLAAVVVIVSLLDRARRRITAGRG